MKAIRNILLLLCLAMPASELVAQSQLSYQGRLDQSGEPFTGTADLVFRLYDQAIGGNQIGGDQLLADWPVEDGLFQVQLDFGPGRFDGSGRFLEVQVDGTTLSPRQAVTAAPLAQFALAGNEGPQGPQGPEGPTGPTGPQGPEGPEGASPFTYDSGSGEIAYLQGDYGYRFNSSSLGSVNVGHIQNQVSGSGAVLSGGTDTEPNAALASKATVAGGSGNRATGPWAFVGGGLSNRADRLAAVAGGVENCAGGHRSFAAGQRAVVRPGSSVLVGPCSAGGGTGDLDGDEGTFIWSDSAFSTPFVSTGPNQFLVRAVGGVGINTNEPAGALHIVGDSPGSVFEGQLVIGGSETTGNAGTGGAIVFEGHDGDIPRIWGGIRSIKENSTDGDRRSMMRFYTRRESGLVERMRIDADGRTYNSDGAWTVLSDRRLKTDIRPLRGALETLTGLRGVSFEYRDPARVGAAPGRRIGFVAQEVSQTLPQWVQASPDGFLSVTTSGFEALAVEALRELTQRLDDRDRRIETLERALQESRQRMDRLAAVQATLRSAQLASRTPDESRADAALTTETNDE